MSQLESTRSGVEPLAAFHANESQFLTKPSVSIRNFARSCSARLS